jgi:hypothetical protein
MLEKIYTAKGSESLEQVPFVVLKLDPKQVN